MLDQQLAAMLAGARAAGAPDLGDLPLEPQRALYRQLTTVADLPVADVAIEDRVIAGPAGNALALRIYRPKSAAAPRGLVLYLHGGGFVLGDPRCYDGVCSNLSALADCVLVQVDYRLAPEHPFPAAVDDCYAALCWLAANAAQIGGDGTRIAVAGDSAGANLAAVMALLARDRRGPALRQQVLLYPVTAATPESFPSYATYGEGYVLSTKVTWTFMRAYLDGKDTATDWRAAPLLANDLRGLPPALVLVAGCDILRDEGVVFADRLAEAGNPMTLIEYTTLGHGFISMGGAIGAARLAVEQVGGALRNALVSTAR